MHFFKQLLRVFVISSFSASLFFFLPEIVRCGELLTASYTPWSGYWWPQNRGGLVTGDGYRGHPAPLEKYDLLTKGTYPKDLSLWYSENFYDPSVPGWYGHCDAWSKASILENYEIFPSSESNIIFRVGDKKGLLTLSHRIDLVEVANGTAENFHLWLLTYLKDQSVPFFADLDLSPEKWYYPIFQCNLNSVKTGSKEAVTATITYATNDVFPDYLGSKTKQQTYTYDLQLDGSGNIIGGQWTGSSVTGHPELLVVPLAQRTDAPLDYEKIRNIAKAKDDHLEAGENFSTLTPGTHNLVLLDPDNYSIATQTGESFSVTLEKKDGSSYDLVTSLENGDGSWSVPGTLVSPNVPLVRKVANSTISPYVLHILQQNYADPNIYKVTLDQRKHFMQQIPLLPKNGMWSGFALTNDSDEAIDNVMLTSHDAKGVPIHTLLGPLTLAPGEKKIFLAESLPFRLHEFLKTQGFTLLADDEVQFVNLIGSGKLLASQVQKDATDQHIIIPETDAIMMSGRSMIGSIRNETLDTNQVSIRSYRRDGSLVIETSKTLAGHEYLPVKPGVAPFTNLPDKGWIDVVSTNGKKLSGIAQLTSRDSLDVLFGLTVDRGTQYISHIPSPNSWLTTVTLINASNEENNLQFHPVLAGSDKTYDITLTLGPHEKTAISIGNEFGRLAGDPLYQSIVAIDGEHEFVGYYTYQKQTGGDIASFPLHNASHFKTKLTMPHNPGADFWWTGIVVCNPLSYAQTVMVDAYDNSGELLVSETRELHLPPGGYEAFTVSALFADVEKDISFVTIRTAAGDGGLGGFYLYGHKYTGSLSGSIM